jgi:hypothetical protein
MMEAVHTSEMSVYSDEITRRNIPEGSHLHTHCHENLKSHARPLIVQKVVHYIPCITEPEGSTVLAEVCVCTFIVPVSLFTLAGSLI